MRVLITIGGYGSRSRPAGPPRTVLSGAELMALRTATALADRGHRVAVLSDGTDLPIDPPLVSVAWPGDGPLPWRPDVVHAFDLARPDAVRQGLAIARRLGVPFVLTPSSAREVWPDAGTGDDACAAADRVFALTQAEVADLALPVPAAARLVGQGPSLAADADPAAFRRTLPGAGPVVLFLGRRGRLKGLDVLRRAAPLVWREVPDAIVAVAGPPWDDDGAGQPDDPRFVDMGAVDVRRKTDAIAACAVLCLPSRADVFPLVFVEAWTLGRPVVSGDFRGVADVVRHGVDGLVCPIRPESVAQALITLLTDDELRTRMGVTGRARAARDMTWAAVAATVESAYREVADTPVGAR